MPAIVYTQDLRLVGVTGVVSAVGVTRLVLPNPLRKTLVTVGISGTAPNVANAALLVQAESAHLAVGPMSVTADASYVYAIGIDTLYRVANGAGLDAAGFAVDSFEVDCIEPNWLLANAGFLYLPRQTSGVSVYTSAGVFVRSYGNLLPHITHAAFSIDGTIVYFLDGDNALGVACYLNNDGTFNPEPMFRAVSCKDVVSIIPDTTTMAVACRHQVNLFDLTDPAAPEFAGSGRFVFQINDMVRVGEDSWWIASDSYVDAQEDRFNYRNQIAGYLGSRGVVAISSQSGRVVCEADFIAFRPDTIYTPPPPPDTPVETSYLLQEDGSVILVEDGTGLEWE